VSCVAGLTVLDVIEDEHLQANAAAVGDHLVARIGELQRRSPIGGAIHAPNNPATCRATITLDVSFPP